MNTVKAKGKQIRRLRIVQGNSIRALAEKAGVNPTTILNLEKDKRTGPSTALKVCSALGAEFEDLFEII